MKLGKKLSNDNETGTRTIKDTHRNITTPTQPAAHTHTKKNSKEKAEYQRCKFTNRNNLYVVKHRATNRKKIAKRKDVIINVNVTVGEGGN